MFVHAVHFVFLHMPPVMARDDTFHSVALPGPVEQPGFRSPPLRLFSKLGHPPAVMYLWSMPK